MERQPRAGVCMYAAGGMGAPPLRPQGAAPPKAGEARRSRAGRGPIPAGCGERNRKEKRR